MQYLESSQNDELFMMHDAEEMEALCQSALRDEGFRQMLTEGNATQKGSGLHSSVCIREGLPYNKMIKEWLKVVSKQKNNNKTIQINS